MKKKDRLLSGPGTIVLLLVILIVCILVSFLFGRYPVPLKELCGILADKFLSVFGGGIERAFLGREYGGGGLERAPA